MFFFCYFQFLRKHPCKKSAANYDRIHDVPEVPATDAIPIIQNIVSIPEVIDKIIKIKRQRISNYDIGDLQ